MKAKTIALLCAGLFLCLSTRAQNLVMNPEMRDLMTCCDVPPKKGEYCSPSAWFTLDGDNSAVHARDSVYKTISVNPQKHISLDFPDYTIVGLMQSLKKKCKYQGTLALPGNKKVILMFAFMDSLPITHDRKKNVALIASLKFDSIVLKSEKNTFDISGRPGRYIIFKLVSTDPQPAAVHTQQIESFRIEPVNCTHDLNTDETRNWIKTVYEERRRHFFEKPCREKSVY